MKLSKIKKLGLPLSQENKLIVLSEAEVRIQELLRNYDPYWVDKDLKDVNEQLIILEIKKKEIIDRQNSEKRTELDAQLKRNKKKQLDIITKHGILGKLRKAIKEIEKVENELVAQTQGQ